LTNEEQSMPRQHDSYEPIQIIPADTRFVVVYNLEVGYETQEILALAVCKVTSARGNHWRQVCAVVANEDGIGVADDISNYLGLMPRDQDPNKFFGFDSTTPTVGVGKTW
jgi:hypothetical protein